MFNHNITAKPYPFYCRPRFCIHQTPIHVSKNMMATIDIAIKVYSGTHLPSAVEKMGVSQARCSVTVIYGNLWTDSFGTESPQLPALRFYLEAAVFQ